MRLKTTLVPPLHTSGNQIVDATGSPVSLRGVMLAGTDQSPSTVGISEDVVAQAKAWGANFVRVPLAEQYWVAGNCNYSAGYASRIGTVVNWITSRGMLALLDLHQNTVSGCQAGQQKMADESESPTFWQQVASQYASNPLVAFDLYNEPHDIPDSVWLNGGSTNDASPYDAAGMQQLYDVVRSTGATNLVFVSGTRWANDPPPAFVRGSNIVYAAHYYTCPNVPPPNCQAPNPYDPSPVLSSWVHTSASAPVVVTEFGWPANSDGTYNANVISFAQSHGWGWAAFAWQQVTNPGPFSIVAFGQDGTAQPTSSGAPILAALRTAP